MPFGDKGRGELLVEALAGLLEKAEGRMRGRLGGLGDEGFDRRNAGQEPGRKRGSEAPCAPYGLPLLIEPEEPRKLGGGFGSLAHKGVQAPELEGIQEAPLLEAGRAAGWVGLGGSRAGGQPERPERGRSAFGPAGGVRLRGLRVGP